MQYEIPYPETIKGKDGGRIPFGPAHDASHRRLLQRNIDRWKTNHPEAADATLDMIDEDRRIAVLKDASVASISRNDNGSFRVNLTPDQSKPSKGAEVASVYERRSPGYRMTEFHPYAGWMLMERLDDELTVARGQIAEYLRVNPWDVKVERMREGGLRLTFQKPFVYKEERDGANLQRAAAAVGHEGWWADVDAKNGTATIHPGEPATFLKTHPYPFRLLGDPECRDRMPYGVLLPRSGGDEYEYGFIDWTKGSFLLLGGEPGMGKSVYVNSLLAQIIAQRPELSIIDLPNKSTDYYWCRPWVTPGHWGCESVTQAAGVMNRLAWEIEHGERAKAWQRNAWQNWLDIPAWAKERFPLHYIIVDEYSSLVDEAKVAGDIPNPERKLPAVFERLFNGQAEYDIRKMLVRLLRTARAQGYRMIVVSQTISEKSGLGPNVRDLFPHHCVMGASPSESMMKGAFHDLPSIPEVPRRVFEDGATVGVGRMEPSGAKGLVFKTAYAGDGSMSDTEALGRMLVERIGVPDDVDADRYLDTLRPHGEDDPVDAEYMHFLTERIDLPLKDAIASDSTLKHLKDAWDESISNFGDDSAAPSASDPLDDDDAAASNADGLSHVPSDDGEGLMDAAALARMMEGRG